MEQVVVLKLMDAGNHSWITDLALSQSIQYSNHAAEEVYPAIVHDHMAPINKAPEHPWQKFHGVISLMYI